MREKLFKGSIVVAMLLLATGCGGGDSSSDDSTSAGTNGGASDVEKKVAYYLDSAVEGVTYRCVVDSNSNQGTNGSSTASVDNSGISGVTDEKGAFNYRPNDICTFSIDEIVLREVDTKELTDAKNIVFEDDENVARFLQTLDIDGNPENGIEIAQEVVAKIKAEAIKLPKTDEEYTQLVTKIQDKVDEYKGHIVTEEEAKSHLEDTKNEIKELNGYIESIVNGAKDRAEGAKDDAKDRAEGAKDDAKDLVDGAKDRAEGAKDDAKDLVDGAKDRAEGAKDDAKDLVTGAKDDAKDDTKDLVDGVKNLF